MCAENITAEDKTFRNFSSRSTFLRSLSACISERIRVSTKRFKVSVIVTMGILLVCVLT